MKDGAGHDAAYRAMEAPGCPKEWAISSSEKEGGSSRGGISAKRPEAGGGSEPIMGARGAGHDCEYIRSGPARPPDADLEAPAPTAASAKPRPPSVRREPAPIVIGADAWRPMEMGGEALGNTGFPGNDMSAAGPLTTDAATFCCSCCFARAGLGWAGPACLLLLLLLLPAATHATAGRRGGGASFEECWGTSAVV